MGLNRMPNGITRPKLIHSVEAEFSDEARRRRIEGTVLVSFTVSEQGLPIDMRIVKSVGYGLDEQALLAVNQYRFEPALQDGKPVPAPVSVEVRFRFAH